VGGGWVVAGAGGGFDGAGVGLLGGDHVGFVRLRRGAAIWWKSPATGLALRPGLGSGRFPTSPPRSPTPAPHPGISPRGIKWKDGRLAPRLCLGSRRVRATAAIGRLELSCWWAAGCGFDGAGVGLLGGDHVGFVRLRRGAAIWWKPPATGLALRPGLGIGRFPTSPPRSPTPAPHPGNSPRDDSVGGWTPRASASPRLSASASRCDDGRGCPCQIGNGSERFQERDRWVGRRLSRCGGDRVGGWRGEGMAGAETAYASAGGPESDSGFPLPPLLVRLGS